MAYEIPQQLQHKEKIIFGLTFSQLAWASLFGTIILLIITSKTYNMTTKFILAMFPSVLGILFIFFDITKWIKNIYNFLRFRSTSLMTPKMKKLIGISKIEKGVIYSKNEVAVFEITPINFSIKTKEEQESITYGFQKFLNSLDFPIQFAVTTHNLNIDKYLDSLGKRVNNKELFNDFSEFMKNNIKKNKMRNRLFYLVIPKRSDLSIQCNVCKNEPSN
jgi:hypothetical protein